MIPFDCPACGHTNHAPPAAAGRKGRCGKCKQPVVVPRPAPPAPPPEAFPPRLRRKRGAPPTLARRLLDLGRTVRLKTRAGFRCRTCDAWTALDRLAMNDAAVCPGCGAATWDLDLTVFTDEEVSVGLLNVALLATGTVSYKHREGIEERVLEPLVPAEWIERLFALKRTALLSEMLVLSDERTLYRLAQDPSAPAYTRSEAETNLLLLGAGLIGLAGLTLLVSAPLLFVAKKNLLVLVGLVVINLAVLAAAVATLVRRSRAPALVASCLSLIPFLGPGMFLGLPLGAYGIKTVRQLDREGAFGPLEDWRA